MPGRRAVLLEKNIAKGDKEKDQWQPALQGIKISAGMEGRERRRDQYPGMEGIIIIDKRHKKGQQQVQQQDAPVLSNLDQHFPQMGLHIIPPDQKRDGKQQGTGGEPDRAFDLRHPYRDVRKKISEAERIGQEEVDR